jgi:hypothetical protein
MNAAYIYALRDPRDGRVFYVGKTVRPWKRLKGHMRTAMCKFLVTAGFSPMLHLLEQCVGEDWRDREKYWIAECRRLGHILSNRHPGGNSRSAGFSQPMSDAQRKKLSELMKGRPLHAAFLERQKNIDSEHLKIMTEKAAEVCRGRKWSDDIKKRISESNKTTWAKKFKQNPDELERYKVQGKRTAERQWEGMSKEQRVACTSQLREWFNKLTPEEKSKVQRERALGRNRENLNAL